MDDSNKIHTIVPITNTSNGIKTIGLIDLLFPKQKNVSDLTKSEKEYIQYFISNYREIIRTDFTFLFLGIALLIGSSVVGGMDSFFIFFRLLVFITICVIVLLINGHHRRRNIYLEYINTLKNN